jgi:capsid protein
MGWIKRRQLRAQIQEQRLALEQRALQEAISLTTSFVDPSDALRDPQTGQMWNAIGSNLDGGAPALIDTEERLRDVRTTARNMALTNEFAINGYENRINYVVGTGHSYTVTAKPNEEVGDEQIEAIQEVVDDFLDENRWHDRQQEIMRRGDRDGECFLRFFAGEEGLVKVRFVEPGEVTTPKADLRPNAKFGIVTEPDDVETVLEYLIEGEGAAPADQIQHRKLGVDSNVKRGVPLFYPVVPNLDRAAQLLKCMSAVASIQAAIAMIRKHGSGTGSTVANWAQGEAEVQQTNQTLGQTFYHKHYAPGTILDTNLGTEYEFPSQGIDASRFVLVLQAELRSIASRLCMPEFMLSSDASNANYASTMVAEGPAVKMFSRLQWSMIEDDLDVMDRVLDAAVEAGRIAEDVRNRIQVDVEPPRLESRDREKEVNADVKLVDGRVMSRRTAMIRQDLDPEVEEEQIDEEREKMDPFDGMQGFGPGGAPPKEGFGDEDGDEDQDAQ